MIERPSRRSTSAPSTFIATSQVPLPRPSRNRPGHDRRDAVPVADARRSRARSRAISDITVIVRAAPSREMTRPASGIETSEPIAIASSTQPELLRVELEPVADLRDPRRPAREREAVEDEDGVDRVHRPARGHGRDHLDPEPRERREPPSGASVTSTSTRSVPATTYGPGPRRASSAVAITIDPPRALDHRAHDLAPPRARAASRPCSRSSQHGLTTQTSGRTRAQLLDGAGAGDRLRRRGPAGRRARRPSPRGWVAQRERDVEARREDGRAQVGRAASGRARARSSRRRPRPAGRRRSARRRARRAPPCAARRPRRGRGTAACPAAGAPRRRGRAGARRTPRARAGRGGSSRSRRRSSVRELRRDDAAVALEPREDRRLAFGSEVHRHRC